MNAIHECLLRLDPVQNSDSYSDSTATSTRRLSKRPTRNSNTASCCIFATAMVCRSLSIQDRESEGMTTDLRIALYQPDIPGNTGTILRMAACLGLTVDIVEPAGFDMSDRALRRAGMDYAEQAALRRHSSWRHFLDWNGAEPRRLILATTQAAQSYRRFDFRHDDILLFGRESAGVPDEVHDVVDARLLIPMVEGRRSLNLAVSAALIVGEALRQTAGEEE